MSKFWFPDAVRLPFQYGASKSGGGPRPMDTSLTDCRKVTWHTTEGGYAQTPEEVHKGASHAYHIIYSFQRDHSVQVCPANTGASAVRGSYRGVEMDCLGKLNVQVCIVGEMAQLKNDAPQLIKNACRKNSNGDWVSQFPKIIQWLDSLGIPRKDLTRLVPGVTYPSSTDHMRRPLRNTMRGGWISHGSTYGNYDRYDGLYFFDLINQLVPLLGKDGKPLNPSDTSNAGNQDNIPNGYGLFEKNYKAIKGTGRDTLAEDMSPRALIGARVIAAGWSPDVIKSIVTTTAQDQWDEHASGKAIDCIIASGKKSEVDDMVDWLVKNANEMAIGSIIWHRKIWDSDQKTWRNYNGPNPHTDHVHVFFNGKPKPGWRGKDVTRGNPNAVNTQGKYRPLPPRVLDRGSWKGVTIHQGASQGDEDPVTPNMFVISHVLAGTYSATALSMSGIRNTSGETGDDSIDIVGAVYPTVSDLQD